MPRGASPLGLPGSARLCRLSLRLVLWDWRGPASRCALHGRYTEPPAPLVAVTEPTRHGPGGVAPAEHCRTIPRLHVCGSTPIEGRASLIRPHGTNV